VRTKELTKSPRAEEAVRVAIVLGGGESQIHGEAAIRSFEMTVFVRDEGSDHKVFDNLSAVEG
jgi:hypothetical protein